MSASHEATKRQQRQLTAAADRSTGQFHCGSSNHFATGTPVIIRGRKVCQACADQRRRRLAAARKGC